MQIQECCRTLTNSDAHSFQETLVNDGLHQDERKETNHARSAVQAFSIVNEPEIRCMTAFL